MPEHMIAPAENTESKAQFFQGVITMINSSIGRKMDNTENQAIAFVVERKYRNGIAPNIFLQDALGVGKDVLPRDAALQIHNRVFEEKLIRIHELMEEKLSDSERLNAWKEQINIGHAITLDNYSKNPADVPYIGGVSLDWVPAWFK